MEPIRFESNIKIEDIPLQWISKIELYYPDLPSFPIVYLNIIKNNNRLYGFPVSVNFDIHENSCDANVLFLCNKDLENSEELKEAVSDELKERFGSKDRIALMDILEGCNENETYKAFFTDLWSYISTTYGETIPYGKYYDEIYSIVRFVAAWQPKTGRQSEMRMLYNFLSIFGERIPIEGKWANFDFFLLPNYKDVQAKSFEAYPKFKTLFSAMETLWKEYFTKNAPLSYRMENGHVTFGNKVMHKSWPQSKDAFIENVSSPLYASDKISLDEKLAMERLVDAFNRHGWRAAYFISSIMTIYLKDYYSWDKDFFISYYKDNLKGGRVGNSPKVIACFLQQGFKQKEFIPIDTWVRTFYEEVLGIKSEIEFFTTFNNLGKIERVIWLASQANKTNILNFFDMLWCQRYGTTRNTELRGANPISCYECKLKITCPSYATINNKEVLVVDKQEIDSEGKLNANTIELANQNNCTFVCVTTNKVPKKIYKKKGSAWVLIDEFSGYLLKDNELQTINNVKTMDQLINELPEFEFNAYETLLEA
ncbi:hypothetical protein MT476_26355 (plasmid) [Bacillus sp. H8-1]|nr:hypothetical protein MT476_26355 [Bacillus sp. H8-1]